MLDELAAGGFKVWYEVGKQLNVCGDGGRAPEKVKQCYNETSTLGWLETNIKIVKDHPALLGYCEWASLVPAATSYNIVHTVVSVLTADGGCPCYADICDDWCPPGQRKQTFLRAVFNQPHLRHCSDPLGGHAARAPPS